jgi:glucoamylase
LLTGERAHYELAAGNDITPLIQTYERFATMGQMMPEQVWDETNSPSARLQLGKPAGSAVPLVWAHAEYLKLLRSALDGKVFDRIDPVYLRYCEPQSQGILRRNLEIYTFRRPIQRIAAGQTLRVLDENRFVVNCTTDQWKTVTTVQSQGIGSAGFSVDISTAEFMAGGELSWTLQWTDGDRWLGYNVNLGIDAPTNTH